MDTTAAQVVHAAPSLSPAAHAASGAFEPTKVPASRNYEDLEGAQGREVFFRPQRHAVEEFAPLPISAQIGAASAWHAAALVDVSQAGAALEWPEDAPHELGATVQLSLRFANHEGYRGEARVTSVRPAGKATIVGVALLEPMASIEELLQLRDAHVWIADPAHVLAARARPWQVDGFETFKSLVGELRLYLEDVSAQLGLLETGLPWSVVHGEPEPPARTAVALQVAEQFVPPFMKYSADIDAALRLADPAQWQTLKQFSLRHLHPLMMQSPVFHRCYHKPLGYPGDFEVMRYIYERHFEGPTLFARAMNLAGIMLPGAAAVRSRKEVLKDILRNTVAHWRSDQPIRLISVASGPAQEIYEFLSEQPIEGLAMEIVLFDQDKQALTLAHGRLTRLLERRHLTRVRVVYLHDSIKRLLHDPKLFAGYGPFDLIFCAGLFDYLKERTAVTLSVNFHDNLASGGTAYIGNMVPTSPSRWIMEHHMEWYLIYRSAEEMLAFAEAAAPTALASILPDPVGVNPLLRIQRT